MVDEDEIDTARGRLADGVAEQAECGPTVAQSADQTGDPVTDPGVIPDAAREIGVVGGQFDRIHMSRRRRAGDPQRAVAAVGAQFEYRPRIGPADRRVEELALHIADVDQQRLVVGVPVEGRQNVIDVATTRMAAHVVDDRAFAPVTYLTGLSQPVRTEYQPPE